MASTKSMFEHPRREFTNLLVTEDFISAGFAATAVEFFIADSVYRERVAPEEGSPGQQDFN